MLSLIVGLLAMQVPVGQPPRLRTLLSNRATVQVERMPNEPTLSIQLFVSARATSETPQTNGRRHLLEHLLARGTKGDLDRRLETAGGYLNAHTTRDVMQFEVTLPAGKLKLGLEAIQETMHMPLVTDQAIRHEADIIAQEGALRTATDKLASAAWTQAYGDHGLDAFGNLDVLRATTIAQLSELHRRMFVGSNLVISIAGDVDLDEATREAADMLRVIPMGELTPGAQRPPASYADVTFSDLGEARGAPAPGLLSPKLAWTLAAGLAVASGLDDSFVTYTPTTRNGLVIVGQTGSQGNLGKAFENAEPKQLVALGRQLARGWVMRQLHDPRSIASFRGMLLAQDAGLRPDTLLENLSAMRAEDFAEGLDAFRHAQSSQPVPVTPGRSTAVGSEGGADFAETRRSTGRPTGRAVQAEPGKARFIEIPDPGYAEVLAVAVVKLPPLDAHERALLGQIIATIPEGPVEYGRRDVMAMTGGQGIRCVPMEDCLTIEIPATKENLSGAVDSLAEMLQKPRMDKAAPQENQPPDPWESILHGPFFHPDGLKTRAGEIADLFHQIFQPDAVTVAVSGPFGQGEAQGLWLQKTQDWKAPRIPRHWTAGTAGPAPTPVVSEFELDGPTIAPSTRDLPKSLLALFALGSGKGASLFRIAREQDGLSYRQEAILWPSRDGWTPRLVVASAGLKDGIAAGEKLKKQLMDDVAAWTELDRQRAAGLAEGVLLLGVPLSPLYFQPDGPVAGGMSDLGFLEAYWQAKTGEHWNPSALALRMKDVPLDVLKAEATRILEASQIYVQSAN